MNCARLTGNDYLFKSRLKKSLHLSTRQYARIVKSWVSQTIEPGAIKTPIANGLGGSIHTISGNGPYENQLIKQPMLWIVY